MTVRNSVICLGILSLSLLPCVSFAHTRHHHSTQEQSSDTPRRHRHHKEASDSDSRSRLHRHRRSEDEASDVDNGDSEHLHRLLEMTRAERAELRRHNHRLYEQQNAQAEQDEQSAREERRRERREAEETADPRRLTRRERRLENEQAAEAKREEAQHEERLKEKQAYIAQRILEHNAKMAKMQAEKAEQAAEARAHWVALHGDGNSTRSIQYWETDVANVPVKVITVDLNDSNIKVSAELSHQGVGTSESFGKMIERANPNVAVTGTFFSLDNLLPVGDIVIDGSLVHFGGMGTALCITPDNRAHMITVAWGRHHDWSPYDFVCACGPRLLSEGHIVLDPGAERFHDQHMLAPNSRIAVGITPGNKLVFVMTHDPIYLGRLAKVMKALGTSEAMNLDAGSSTGLFYNGTTLAWPGRRLTNMIVVYSKKEQYERNLDQLLPANYKRADSGESHPAIPQPQLASATHS